jgi:hypothetical protein
VVLAAAAAVDDMSAGHNRARKLKPRDRCELKHIGGCRGRIEIHHKDKNTENNADENLMALCITHHTLVELGRIDLAAPVMPPFYVDRSGKRRYLHGWLRGHPGPARRASLQAAGVAPVSWWRTPTGRAGLLAQLSVARRARWDRHRAMRGAA